MAFSRFKARTRIGPSPALTQARNQMEAMRKRFATIRRAGQAAPKAEIMTTACVATGGALGGLLDAKLPQVKLGPVTASGVIGLGSCIAALTVLPKVARGPVLCAGSGMLAYYVGDFVFDMASKADV